MIYPLILSSTYSTFIVVCEALLRIPHTQPVAQGLQSEAEGGRRAACGLRWRHGEQAPQSQLANRDLCGERQRMAVGVVLYHRTPRRHMGRRSRVQIRAPNAAYILA